MFKTIMSGAIAVCVAGAGSAALAAYAAATTITPQAGDSFDVRANISPGTSTFWCGAAVHAQSALDLPANTRLYVVAPRRSGAEGSVVRFGLTPPQGGAVQSASTSVDLVGNALSVAQAKQFCYDKTITD